jgi:hypothetical protein
MGRHVVLNTSEMSDAWACWRVEARQLRAVCVHAATLASVCMRMTPTSPGGQPLDSARRVAGGAAGPGLRLTAQTWMGERVKVVDVTRVTSRCACACARVWCVSGWHAPVVTACPMRVYTPACGWGTRSPSRQQVVGSGDGAPPGATSHYAATLMLDPSFEATCMGKVCVGVCLCWPSRRCS